MAYQTGIGVLINQLSYRSDGAALKELVERELEIDSMVMVEDTLCIAFKNGACLKLWDDGQSCCEYRYMHTDDVLSVLPGEKLVDISIESGPEEGHDDVKESQFLRIHTDKSTYTVVNYNEHNGYYGGFSLTFDIIEPESGVW